MNDILERYSLYLENLKEKEQTSSDEKKQTSIQSEMIMIETETLQQKEMQLMKENNRLKQQVKVGSEFSP
ncbi:hypothetical protein ACET3Z_007328 [Daucus carota]